MNLIWSRIRETLELKATCRVALRLLRYDHWIASKLVLAPADQSKLISFFEVREKLHTRRSAKYRRPYDANGELHAGSSCLA